MPRAIAVVIVASLWVSCRRTHLKGTAELVGNSRRRLAPFALSSRRAGCRLRYVVTEDKYGYILPHKPIGIL